MSSIVVIDIGTSSLKCGFSTDNVPACSVASALGRQILQTSSKRQGSRKTKQEYIMKKGFIVGNDAIELADSLEMYYPILNGIVKDKEQAELIFQSALEQLGVQDCSDHYIMLTQASESPIKHTQFLLELFLEKFGFKKAYVATQGYLSLVGSGLTTGIVLDSGAGVSHIIPFYDNTVFPSTRLNVAGSHITNHLLSLFQRRGYSMNHSADFILCDKIKRSYCFVAQDTDLEQKLCDETTFNDHKIETDIGNVNASDELFLAPEILFKPIHIDIEKPGIGELIFDTIQNQPTDLRMAYYKSIVLSGGTTMTPGIRKRLEKEVKQLSTAVFGSTTAAKQSPKILDNPNRMTSVFRGAGILANFAKNSTKDFWITKELLQSQGGVKCIKGLL